MKFFSQRKGLKPVRSVIQKDEMDSTLRTGLWNAVYLYYLEEIDHIYQLHDLQKLLLKNLWLYYFHSPLDEMQDDGYQIVQHFKKHFLTLHWNEVYDLLEAFVLYDPETSRKNRFTDFCNSILERELSACRFVGHQIAEITSEQEIAAIEEVLESPISPVQKHLSQALNHFADRENPDYRNSIKESISAVEAICSQIANKPHATLGEALKEIDRNTNVDLHPALKRSFESLYGYTSDAQGIRHALTEEPQLGSEDAKFMLVSCSAFINYLTEKAQKAGIKL
jgi:hypothetical protein